MDDKLQRRILRQLRILNFWIASTVVLLLLTLGLLAFMAYRALGFINETRQQIQRMQQQTQEAVDLQAKLCGGGGSVAALLRESTDICR